MRHTWRSCRWWQGVFVGQALVALALLLVILDGEIVRPDVLIALLAVNLIGLVIAAVLEYRSERRN